jgi:YggT family protein
MIVIQWLLTIYLFILIARVLFSWLPPEAERGVLGKASYATRVLTEPVLAPVRKVVPVVRIGDVGLDLSVMIVILVLVIVRSIIR